MTEKIISYIAKFVELTDEERLEIGSVFKVAKVKKRPFIVQPGFVTRHRNYVVEGAFRAYVVGEKGQDHTINFAVDDWWITDYNSYIFQQPATMFVVALEDSVILQIDYASEQRLKAQHHRLETFFRIIAERGLASQQRRIISNLTHSAEERYENFVATYPQIAQRVPQYALASFLGMTTEFLSRIRSKRVSGKS